MVSDFMWGLADLWDLSGVVFPHEDIHFFTKSAAKLVSGFDYSHEDIARFASK